MRRREDIHEPHPDEAAELAALERALAGEPVDPAHAELEALVRAVRAERPRPDQRFAAELDERVAAGFPRRGAAPSDAPRRRRLTLPLFGSAGVAVAAAAAVVIATGVFSSGPPRQITTLPGAGGAATPATKAAPAAPNAAATDVQTLPAPVPVPAPVEPGAPRRVQRDASLALSTSPDQLANVADRVVRTVDRLGGIVLSSSVTSDEQTGGEANFDLSVPATRLADTLRALSRLAHVRARSEGTLDITGSFTSARTRLDEALAERRGLLRALAAATTPNQTASVKARLRLVAGRIARDQALVKSLAQRSDRARVSVTVTGGDKAAGSGSWTLHDALHDALRVLAVALGVVLIALAALVPLAIAGALAWATLGAIRRRRRERALDAAL